jgi:hypothetical protein
MRVSNAIAAEFFYRSVIRFEAIVLSIFLGYIFDPLKTSTKIVRTSKVVWRVPGLRGTLSDKGPQRPTDCCQLVGGTR